MWTRPFLQLEATGLPIFRQEFADHVLFYAPGYLAVTPLGWADSFEQELASPTFGRWPDADKLRRHAATAQTHWAKHLTTPFTPVCLTLYLHNECNLNCSYCYAMPSVGEGLRLDLPTIRAAALLVAKNCRAQGRPFTVVFHGGGEPSLHRQLVDEALSVLDEVAAEHGLVLFRYIATNGVMSSSKAAWLASRFDLIGLSCDGPTMIQGQQRPLRDGENSLPLVERTARIVREAGRTLHVRVTVTPASLEQLGEIARFVCEELRPKEIHIEPVYQAGRARREGCFEAEQAEAFVTRFLQGRNIARQHGIDWKTSGSRPGEIHGPYCQILRDVLQVVPGSGATTCFKTGEVEEAQKQEALIGQLDGDSGKFIIDQARIQSLRYRLAAEAPQCSECFNRYHCARTCPDECPLMEAISPVSFRCAAQKMLVAAQLQEVAAELWHSAGQNAMHSVKGREVVL